MHAAFLISSESRDTLALSTNSHVNERVSAGFEDSMQCGAMWLSFVYFSPFFFEFFPGFSL